MLALDERRLVAVRADLVGTERNVRNADTVHVNDGLCPLGSSSAPYSYRESDYAFMRRSNGRPNRMVTSPCRGKLIAHPPTNWKRTSSDSTRAASETMW